MILASTQDNSSNATTSVRMKFWNDCASVVKSCWNSEWYAPLTLRIRIHGLTQYRLRDVLRFLLIRIPTATITMYCQQTAVTNISSSKSAILALWTSSDSPADVLFLYHRDIDRRLWHFIGRYYRPTYRLVRPLLYVTWRMLQTAHYLSGRRGVTGRRSL